MKSLLQFLDPLLPWLDARCLTKLLMTGDGLLKAALQQNVTDVIQYYHADPVLNVWQFPTLALTNLPKVTRVVLITDRVSVIGEYNITNSYSYKYHPLRRVDFTAIPRTVTELVLKFGDIRSHFWTGVDLPYLRTADIGVDFPDQLSLFLPVSIISKLVNQDLPIGANHAAGINEITAALTAAGAQATDIHFPRIARCQPPLTRNFLDVFNLHFAQHHQLSSLSLKSVSPIIDLYVLPRTLTELRAISCSFLNHTAIELLPLTVLMLACNVWYEYDPEISQDTVRECNNITIVCPSTTLNVFCAGNPPFRCDVLLRLPNTVIYINYQDEGISLEFGNPGGFLPRLNSINVVMEIVNNPAKTACVVDMVRKSPNLKFASFRFVGDDSAGAAIISALASHCSQLKRLVLSTSPSNLVLGTCGYPARNLPHSLVECCTPFMFYRRNLMLTTDYVNLQVLVMSINMREFKEFNQLLEEFWRLRYLKLTLHSIVTAGYQGQHDISVSAPPSLTSLSIEIGGTLLRRPPENLALIFSGEGGIPPKMRSIHLAPGSNITLAICRAQAQILPTTLEWCYPLPQPSAAITRLHNLLLP